MFSDLRAAVQLREVSEERERIEIGSCVFALTLLSFACACFPPRSLSTARTAPRSAPSTSVFPTGSRALAPTLSECGE
jgi:hypothetical protein